MMLKKCKVWIFVLLLVFGVGLSSFAETNSNTVITSETLEVDYNRFTAVFDGDVVLDDPQMHLESENMRVIFKKKPKEEAPSKDDDKMSNVVVRSVTALGNVRIRTEGRTATCAKAIYLAAEGEVILSGDAVLKRDKNTLKGDRVTFWLHESVKDKKGTMGQGSVKSVLASGNVRMESENKSAECGKVVYTESSGKVVMTEDAVLHQEGDSLYGDQVTFWMGEDGMETAKAVGHVRMIYGSGTKKGKEEDSDGGE